MAMGYGGMHFSKSNTVAGRTLTISPPCMGPSLDLAFSSSPGSRCLPNRRVSNCSVAHTRNLHRQASTIGWAWVA
jgi:hypothetical protein